MMCPERITTTEPIPYKVNGWVGTTFVPYEKKYKGVKERTRNVCGLCAAQDYLEREQQGGADVNELQLEILKLAENETTARSGAAVSQGTAGPMKKTNGKTNVSRRRNGRKATGPRARRPRMTEEQAVTFPGHSMASMVAVESVLKCDCMPYADVFTYNRWRAQGFQVQRGSKAISLPLVKDVEETDEHGAVTNTRRVLGTSKVFCRCQTEPMKEVA